MVVSKEVQCLCLDQKIKLLWLGHIYKKLFSFSLLLYTVYAHLKCVCATLYLGRHKGLIKWILPGVPVRGKAARRQNMKAHFGGKDSDNMQIGQSNGGRGVMVGGSAVKWSRDTIYVTLSQGLITAGCEQYVDLRVGGHGWLQDQSALHAYCAKFRALFTFSLSWDEKIVLKECDSS